MKSTRLIVKTTRADMLSSKAKLQEELEKKHQLKKWSDTVVESRNELTTFKVIAVNELNNIPSQLNGFDKVETNELIAVLEDVLGKIKEIADVGEDDTDNTGKSEADSGSQDDENTKDDKGSEKDKKSGIWSNFGAGNKEGK